MSPQQFALEMNKGGDDREGSRRISIPFLYNPVGEIVSVMQSRLFQILFHLYRDRTQP